MLSEHLRTSTPTNILNVSTFTLFSGLFQSANKSFYTAFEMGINTDLTVNSVLNNSSAVVATHKYNTIVDREQQCRDIASRIINTADFVNNKFFSEKHSPTRQQTAEEIVGDRFYVWWSRVQGLLRGATSVLIGLLLLMCIS